MDDLRSTRPEPSSAVERYSPQEKGSAGKAAQKKAEKPKHLTARNFPVPEIEEVGDAQDHQLDERA
jgi:hypothetical protein